MTTISQLFQEAKESFRREVDVNLAVGDPIENGDRRVVPVFKVSYALVSGAADVQNKKDNSPFGVLGGGATVTPIGFFVTEDDDYNYIKTDSDAGDRWFEIIQKLIKK